MKLLLIYVAVAVFFEAIELFKGYRSIKKALQANDTVKMLKPMLMSHAIVQQAIKYIWNWYTILFVMLPLFIIISPLIFPINYFYAIKRAFFGKTKLELAAEAEKKAMEAAEKEAKVFIETESGMPPTLSLPDEEFVIERDHAINPIIEGAPQIDQPIDKSISVLTFGDFDFHSTQDLISLFSENVARWKVDMYANKSLEATYQKYINIFVPFIERLKALNIEDVVANSTQQSETLLFARQELDALFSGSQTEHYLKEFEYEILSLVDRFSKSDNVDGGTANLIASDISNVVFKLCMRQPISPITNSDEDWMKYSDGEYSDGEYQHFRCMNLFKHGKEGKPYYLDAIVWNTQDGRKLCNGRAGIPADGGYVHSRQYVKSFPFTPKTFVINVIETEVDEDSFILRVDGITQLEKVFEYYDKYE